MAGLVLGLKAVGDVAHESRVPRKCWRLRFLLHCWIWNPDLCLAVVGSDTNSGKKLAAEDISWVPCQLPPGGSYRRLPVNLLHNPGLTGNRLTARE